jgi:hypothetical protein
MFSVAFPYIITNGNELREVIVEISLQQKYRSSVVISPAMVVMVRGHSPMQDDATSYAEQINF